MSGIFGGPKTPKLPPQPEQVEKVEVIEEEAGRVKKRERKKLLTGGRRATIISGIKAVLKKRLGE